MNYQEELKRYISCCGSYCHTCDWHTGKIRKTYQQALEMLEEYGFKRLFDGKTDVENLKVGLRLLANSDICSGCKAEIANDPAQDRCRIRQCCHARGFDLCSQCPEYPCATLKENSGVQKFGCLENLREIQERGLEAWIDQQWRNDPEMKNL